MQRFETYYIREEFREFQQKAFFFNLAEFSYEVSPISITIRCRTCAYPPWPFDFFENMWNKMSQEDRRKNCLSTILLYREILLQHARRCLHVQEIVLFLRRTFTPLLRLARDISPQMVSFLVVICRGALEVEVGVFLRIVSREDLALVLECFPTHRFDGWGIQKSRALMRSLEDTLFKLGSICLIQYGFPYLFDNQYFRANLIHMWRREWDVQINWKTLCTEFHQNIIDSGNLRMQLALEFLLLLFKTDTEGKFLNILDLLWRAVPFPYISYTEMFTLLKPFFKGEYLSLKEVCDEYRECNFLFEVPEVTEPRTLQHLCRVQIRKSMRDANTISDETIDSLEDVPRLLKDYLKLTYREVENWRPKRQARQAKGQKRKKLNWPKNLFKCHQQR